MSTNFRDHNLTKLFNLFFITMLMVGCTPKAIDGLISLSSSIQLEFSSESLNVSESAGNIQVTLPLSKVSSEESSFQIVVSGTSDSNDHNLVSQTITVPAGSTQVSIPISLVDDSFIEGNETLVISLVNPSIMTFGSTNVLTITIEDDEDFDPLNLVATVDSSSAVTLDWDSSAGAGESGYRIAYLTGAMAPIDCDTGTVISEASVSGTLHQVTGLSSSTLYSFRVCGVDSDSPANTSAGAVASATTVTPAIIYRSLGADSGSLSSGASGGFTIAGSVATFASGVPEIAGVGDVIQYDCDEDNDGIAALDANDCVIFIHGRIDDYNFTVANADGSSVTDMPTPDVDWTLYRTYTSIANAESGVVNTNIDPDLQANVTGGDRDLVANGEQWNLAVYGLGAFTVSDLVFFSGWNTNIDSYLRIFAPSLPTEVGVSQRHKGYFEASKALVRVVASADYARGFRLGLQNVYIEGLQFLVEDNGFQFASAIYADNTVASDSWVHVYSNNIVRLESGGGDSAQGIAANTNSFPNAQYFIYNNIVSGFSGTDGYCYRIYSTAYVYNNTAADCNRAFRTFGNATLINNLAQNGPFVLDAFDASQNNISEDATSPDGAGFQNISVTFSDPNTFDFTLSPDDTGAIDQGVDLSSDPNIPFNFDIAGNQRAKLAGWDIGASEAGVRIYRSVGPSNTSVLDSGGGSDTMDIVNGTANFATTWLDENIGQGDAIIYDSDSRVVFIHSVIDRQNVILKMADGSQPPDISGSTDWSVYRSYTSLADAEAGIVNASIPGAIQPLVTGGDRDLVLNNEQWNISLYADAVDTDEVYVTGWHTDKNRKLRLYTPHATNEAYKSHRHQGVFDSSNGYALIVNTASTAILRVQLDPINIAIEGLQIDRTGADARVVSIESYANDSGGHLWFKNNIVSGNVNAGTHCGCTVLDNTGPNSKAYIVNNLFFGTTGSYGALYVYGGLTFNWDAYVYNNTFVSNNIAIYARGTRAHPINNILYANGGSFSAPQSGQILNADFNISDVVGQTTGFSPSYRDGLSTTPTFVDSTNGDYNLSPSDTLAKNQGADLSSDSNFAFSVDYLQRSRGNFGGWDLGMHEAGAVIYRSFGQGNTTALDTSATGTMDISSGVATFSAGISENVGVGDAIVYDSDSKIVFIHGRTDSQTFQVATVDGDLPADIATNSDWSIFRAYTQFLINVFQGVNENSGIPLGLRNFDNAPDNQDFIERNIQLKMALYADAVVNTGVNFQQGRTSKQNYVHFFVPYKPTEVGISQRHSGYWDDSKARIQATTSGSSVWVAQDYTVVDGLQVELPDVASTTIDPVIELYTDNVTVKNNLVKKDIVATTSNKMGIAYYNGVTNGTIVNNIIFGFDGANEKGIDLGQSINSVVYNNTIFGSTIGMDGNAGSNPAFIKNNLLASNGTDYSANATVSSNNITSDATSPDGGAFQNLNPSFWDGPGGDLRLEINDTAAIDAGADLSSDPYYAFSEDLVGATRSAPWDVGATMATPDPSLYTAYNDEGSGTMGDPYNIYTKDQLKDIGASGCNGSTTVACGSYFEIQDDIDLNMEAYTPIGNCTNAFTGNFDGGGFTISNLTINLPATNCVGLIGYTIGATVINVVLSNVDIQGDQFVGSLVGQATDGTSIVSSTAQGLVDSYSIDVGGIVGHVNTNSNTITSVSADVDIGTRNTAPTAGGLIGYCTDTATITNSYAQGDVYGTGELGGMVGEANTDCDFTDSYATGNVETMDASHVQGGFVGLLSGTSTLTRVYATGNVIGNNYSGGLIGRSIGTGSIIDSYAKGVVRGVTYIGGFIGRVESTLTITGSHALGDVSGTGTYDVGGFIGSTLSTAGATITTSWAGGDVRSVGYSVGGFIGWNGDTTITDSFALGNVFGENIEVGGFAGELNDGAVTRCYAKGNVHSSHTGTTQTGGFVGLVTGSTITESYATGNVSASGAYVGGFVGGTGNASASTITKSFATGNVVGTGYAGGFMGYQGIGSVSESYATGNVWGYDQVGGFTGFQNTTLNNNFATGDVFGNQYVGGFAGHISAGSSNFNYSLGKPFGNGFVNAFAGDHSGGSVSYSYFNSDVTGSMNATQGVAETANVYEAKAAYELQLSSTFSANWNYTTIWTQADQEGFPVLKWTPEGKCIDNPTAATYNAIGSGSLSDPYVICNKEQLQHMNACGACTSHFVFGSDIDLLGEAVTNMNSGDSGTIDGRGHRIYNMVGFWVGSSSGLTVKNLVFINSKNLSVSDSLLLGGPGKVFNLKMIGSSVSDDNTAGLFTYNDVDLYHSVEFIGDFTAQGETAQGIFAGWGSPDIYRGAIFTDINQTGTAGNLAGFVGRGGGFDVVKGYATGSIQRTGSSTAYLGGIIGTTSYFNMIQTYATLDISAPDALAVSGLTGRCYDTDGIPNYVRDSYFYGTLNVPGSDYVYGGVSGIYAGCTAINSYAVTPTLVGSSTGGFGGGTGLSGNFWNSEITLETDCGLSGGSTPGVCEGKTTAEMDDDATFTGAGWDTTYTWLLRTDVTPPQHKWNLHPICHANGAATTYNAIGSGVPQSPYLICFKEQLIDLAANGCNSGTSTAGCGSHYVLLNDIDLYRDSMSPIGSGTTFTGVFEGMGNKIINFSLSSGVQVGLFTELGSGARISNLELIRVSISGTGDRIGAIAGLSNGAHLNNILVTGDVSGDDIVGGVVGQADSNTLLNKVSFFGDVTAGSQGGGVVGSLDSGVMTASYASGTVDSGNAPVGGLAARVVDAKVYNSSASTIVTNTGSFHTGGFTGESTGVIYNSYSLGTVNGNTARVGGFIGSNSGVIFDSFAMAVVNSDSGNTGGFVGQGGGSVVHSFSAGSFIGTSTDGFSGGAFSGAAFYNYYDQDAAQNSVQNVTGEKIPLTTVNMQNSANFTGWDFANTWKSVAGDYHSYRGGFLSFQSSAARPTSLTEGEEYIDTTGLVGLYHFDEATMDENTNFTITDATATASDGTLVTGDGAGNKAVAGKVGSGAIDLDGSGDYISFGAPAEFNITGAMTVTAWINADAANNFYVVSNAGDFGSYGWDLSANISGSNFVVEFRSSTDGTDIWTSGNSSELVTGTWYHLVGVIRPSESIEIWVNGRLESINTTGIPATFYDSPTSVQIGIPPKTGGPTNMDGRVDEVSIWNRALSPSEIVRLFSRQK